MGLELEVKADEFGGFGVNEFVDEASGFVADGVDTLRSVFVAATADEWVDIATFADDVSSVGLLFGGGGAVGGGGALELTKGFADGFIATAEDPFDDFALVHDEEIFHGEVALVNHGADDVSEELEGSTGVVADISFEEWHGETDKIFANFLIGEAEFEETIFVFENGDVFVEAADLFEIPSFVAEEAVAEGVLEAVGSEARSFVVGERIELVVGDFAGEDAVALQEAHDAARAADKVGSVALEGFLM